MDLMEQCVAHLQELIAWPTQNPGGDESGMCALLSRHLRKLGADSVSVREIPRSSSKGAYVYARFGTPTLLLNVHIDTVPANSGWTKPPLEAEITADRIFGLGSCDIKGAIAVILSALSQTQPKNLGVLFSGDEEAGSACMQHFLANTDTSEIKTAIVCEPTARTAGIRHRGVQAHRALYVGQGGHSSKADTMEKPVVELAKLALSLDAIGRSYLERGPEGMKGVCMNVAKLSGGVAYNVVPDQAELSFSVRPPPGFDAAEFDAKLEQAAQAAHRKIQLSLITSHEPFACGSLDEVKRLVGDHVSKFVSLDFWTEAALLQTAGIDAIVIGPGDIAQAHTANEYVLLDDLRWALDLFDSVLKSHAS